MLSDGIINVIWVDAIVGRVGTRLVFSLARIGKCRDRSDVVEGTTQCGRRVHIHAKNIRGRCAVGWKKVGARHGGRVQ